MGKPRQPKPRYVTARDIIIPAGTSVQPPPIASTRWASDHEAVVALGHDHTAYLSLDIKEGVASGFIREAD